MKEKKSELTFRIEHNRRVENEMKKILLYVLYNPNRLDGSEWKLKREKWNTQYLVLGSNSEDDIFLNRSKEKIKLMKCDEFFFFG